MKKINFWFFVMCFCLLCTLSINAQVTVTNNNTIKLGTNLNTIGTNVTGNYEQAAGITFGNSSFPGTLIEQGNGESSGIYLDGDKIVIWSPGDVNLVNFCDEDLMEEGTSNYTSAVVAYIDDAGYYFQISDSTSKENITTINAPLSKIIKLRGVEYFHKTVEKKNNDTSNGPTPTKSLKCGFLAQEVETVIPEAVATNNSGKKFVNYQAIIPFLVEALKEQQTQIAKQDQQIKLLQAQVSEIQQSLNLK
ncbi:MAG TPA: tail fiber domain-containing protein [Bacteroidales bacterium]|nr:tail fiber domain-containing protein [Bacteroidales bacterium]